MNKKLTVSRKKKVNRKKSNHKTRSRVLLLSLMCYAFMCSGSENYNRNRKCRKCLHNFIVAGMSLRELTDVLTALLFYDFLLSSMLTGCDGRIGSNSK